ncbi:hypothetical protein FHS94_000045 [Sphingomonas aerophila]|uniref:Uncharacterized protein n=1 Tax=Sphingomonas aerophila TaxID=1344948 RepID=A0A7W9ESK8_9SPHN|nr:hypothetical protein [Sphingomonas aerophila]
MLNVGAITYLGLLASSSGVPSKAATQPIVTFASAPSTCAVLQAAYTAAIGRTSPAYPQDVRLSPHGLDDLRKFMPDYRARMKLSEGEFEDLARREHLFNLENFRPACRWTGQTGPTIDDEGHKTFVTFTSPIFSKNRRLALVEVSFLEEGRFGYGVLCTVRLSKAAWTARCLQSWIT